MLGRMWGRMRVKLQASDIDINKQLQRADLVRAE